MSEKVTTVNYKTIITKHPDGRVTEEVNPFYLYTVIPELERKLKIAREALANCGGVIFAAELELNKSLPHPEKEALKQMGGGEPGDLDYNDLCKCTDKDKQWCDVCSDNDGYHK